MRMIKLAVVLCFCSSVVLAETTLEIIQQRAEAGDATAQALLGIMAFHGYQVQKNSEASQEWYQRAADQGDSFAAGRIGRIKKKSESEYSPLFLPKNVLEKKVADAFFVEYKGNLTLGDLMLKRAEYIGNVVKLKFRASTISTTSGISSMYVRDVSGVNGRLMLCGSEALEWAVKESKRGDETYSTAYVFVDEKYLIALGKQQSQADNCFIYSW